MGDEIPAPNKARFVIFRGKDRKYYFRLQAENNKTIAVSEGYERIAGAMNGIKAVKRCAGVAEAHVEINLFEEGDVI